MFRSFVFLFLSFLFAFTLASLGSFNPEDPSLLSVTLPVPASQNFGGEWGANLAAFLMFYLGYATFLPLSLLLIYTVLAMFFREQVPNGFCFLTALFFVTGPSAYVLTTFLPTLTFMDLSYPSAGLFGIAISTKLAPLCGPLGTFMVMLFSFLLFLALLLVRPSRLIEKKTSILKVKEGEGSLP